MWYDVVINGGGMAATPLFAAQAKKILSGALSFVAFLRYVSALLPPPFPARARARAAAAPSLPSPSKGKATPCFTASAVMRFHHLDSLHACA